MPDMSDISPESSCNQEVVMMDDIRSGSRKQENSELDAILN